MTVRLALVVLCALAGARAYACAGLGVEHAWLREPPPGTSMAAAYFDLVNRGLQAVHITALASADFGSAMLHTTQIIEGRAQMRELETVELVPGARFSAAPGGANDCRCGA